MLKIINIILILICIIASIYNSYKWVLNPDTALLYIKAGIPVLGIKIVSLFLGIGGLLLLSPQTFEIGGAFLIVHSLITIICYVITKDLKGGLFEFVLLQIPIFLVWTGYPLTTLDKLRNFFTN